jgi:hypothetical protein
MIKASDLRVGNWLLLDTGVCLPSPHCIMAKDIYDISEGKITLNALEPILLTPEILEKAGFEKEDKDNVVWFRKQPLLIEFVDYYNMGYSARFIINQEESRLIYKIDHLHQLQNLYYALTNSELTINL